MELANLGDKQRLRSPERGLKLLIVPGFGMNDSELAARGSTQCNWRTLHCAARATSGARPSFKVCSTMSHGRQHH